MYIQFLGTQAGLPGKFRNPSSLVLDLTEEVRGGETVLIDCGEGTQTQMIRQEDKIKNGSRPSLLKIKKIFITHRHLDHIGGLIGLLATSCSLGRTEQLEIYGPNGLKEWVEVNLQFTKTHVSFPLTFTVVERHDVFTFEDYKVTVYQLKHDVSSFGYHFEMNDKPGTLDIQKAIELGVPKGPQLGLLKNGHDVTLDDGRVITSKDVVGEMIKGKSILVCGDSKYQERFLNDFPKDLDAFVYEGTLDENESDIILGKYMHSTYQQAARLGKEIGAKQTFINHLSARYLNLKELQQNVEEINETAIMVKDFDSFKI